MNKATITKLLDQCQFCIFDHHFQFRVMTKGDGYLIQVMAFMADNVTGERCWQKGGKHFISKHAIAEEVVNKAFKACIDFAEHEVREGFRYKGAAIYHPHWQVDKLVDYCRDTPAAKRDEGPEVYLVEEKKKRA